MIHTLRNVVGIVSLVFAGAVSSDTAFSVEDWTHKDAGFKLALIQNWIQIASSDGVTLRQPPGYYVEQIDALVQSSIANGDTAGLRTSLGISLKTIAIMDCDWDDGSDSLETARAFLGEENLAAIQEMYPDKYAALTGGCPH